MQHSLRAGSRSRGGAAAHGGLRDLPFRPVRRRAWRSCRWRRSRWATKASGGWRRSARESRRWRPATARASRSWRPPAGLASGALRGASASARSRSNFGYTLQGALTDYAIGSGRGAWCACRPICRRTWRRRSAAPDGRHTARLREAGLERGQTVGLFGLGGLGHLALQMARLPGLRIAAVDVSDEKLEMAREAGAEITAKGETAGRTLQKEIGGVDAAIVFTPSPGSHPAGFPVAQDATARWCWWGFPSTTYELPLVDTVVKGITDARQLSGHAPGPGGGIRTGARRGHLRPHVQTHAIEETPALLEKMRRGEIAGRAVIAFCKIRYGRRRTSIRRVRSSSNTPM